MLAVENLSIQYGARSLFQDLCFTIRAKERWALAGPNGSGKSTLMKIIAGIETPDQGRLSKAKQSTIGYLPQEGVEHKGASLFEEASKAFDDVLRLQKDLLEVEEQLEACDPTAEPERYGDLLEVFGDIQLRLDHHDVERMKPQIEKVLNGLGFKSKDMDRACEEYSGGWQMRIALAKLLLREPSVLLLDEPTNHLDIETVQWLEQWLRNYGGAVVLISHDRSMLDNLTNRTLAFENGQVQLYSGNYSFYLREREARKEQLERAYVNQQREIERAQKLINRFRAKASKAKMVQSRIKQLDKIELIEMEQDASSIKFRFPQPERSGETVLKMEGINKYYGELHVLRNLNLQIERADRIAIVGVNGAGKSTFSRLISQAETPTSGEMKFGHKVAVSYFSQTHADELDPTRTVLETMEKAARTEASGNLRSLLGAFLFRGDDVFKRVGVLSGGERGRLALARMLLLPANFLILDEPTNHLDLQSQEVLQNALLNYEGTYVMVSHNRSFLDPIVTKVLEFIPGEPPKLYYGNVSDYLEKKAMDVAGAAAAGRTASAKHALSGGSVRSAGSVKSEPSSSGGGQRKEQRRQEAEARQARAKQLKPLKDEFQKLEAEIREFEKEKANLSEKLMDPDFFRSSGTVASDASARIAKLDGLLEGHFTRWGEISEKIEELEASQSS